MLSCPGHTAGQTLQPLKAEATADVLAGLVRGATGQTSLMLHRLLTLLSYISMSTVNADQDLLDN